jgi:WD40 repeat protein
MESKKVVAVGEGSGMLAKVFMWDTGNSVGEIVGHNKRIISVAYKPTRPFRIMTGSEDMRTIFYQGPPFKLDHSNNNCHTNFVNCVRYSNDGNHVVSVGSDKKVQFYNGATGEPSNAIANAHTGTVYSAAFSPDSTKLATASADKTVKIWDVATQTCEKVINFSDDAQVGDMQVSIVWTAQCFVSVSLNGDFNVLSVDSDKPVRVIQNHQVAITSMYLDREKNMLYTGSFDGLVISRLFLFFSYNNYDF